MQTSADLLNAVAAVEKKDGVIGFPTDTVYGLGCKVNHPNAIEKIYQLKGRDENKPLILLGVEKEAFIPFVETVFPKADELMDAHWPGALTLVLPKSDKVPGTVTRNLTTVGLRVPDCPVLIELLKLIPEGVLATTSANKSGDDACTKAGEVFTAFGNSLDYLLMDDSQIQQGVASTVAEVKGDEVIIYRQGSVEI